MWWNFVGRTHEEVVGFRDDWMAQLADGGYADGRFGIPIGDDLPPIPAPAAAQRQAEGDAAGSACRRRRSGCRTWVRWSVRTASRAARGAAARV